MFQLRKREAVKRLMQNIQEDLLQQMDYRVCAVCSVLCECRMCMIPHTHYTFHWCSFLCPLFLLWKMAMCGGTSKHKFLCITCFLSVAKAGAQHPLNQMDYLFVFLPPLFGATSLQ